MQSVGLEIKRSPHLPANQEERYGHALGLFALKDFPIGHLIPIFGTFTTRIGKRNTIRLRKNTARSWSIIPAESAPGGYANDLTGLYVCGTRFDDPNAELVEIESLPFDDPCHMSLCVIEDIVAGDEIWASYKDEIKTRTSKRKATFPGLLDKIPVADEGDEGELNEGDDEGDNGDCSSDEKADTADAAADAKAAAEAAADAKNAANAADAADAPSTPKRRSTRTRKDK